MRDQDFVKRFRKYQKAHIQSSELSLEANIDSVCQPVRELWRLQNKDDGWTDRHSKHITQNREIRALNMFYIIYSKYIFFNRLFL